MTTDPSVHTVRQEDPRSEYTVPVNEYTRHFNSLQQYRHGAAARVETLGKRKLANGRKYIENHGDTSAVLCTPLDITPRPELDGLDQFPNVVGMGDETTKSHNDGPPQDGQALGIKAGQSYAKSIDRFVVSRKQQGGNG